MQGPNWYYSVITRTMLSLNSQKYAKHILEPFCLFFLGQQHGPVGKSIAVQAPVWIRTDVWHDTHPSCSKSWRLQASSYSCLEIPIYRNLQRITGWFWCPLILHHTLIEDSGLSSFQVGISRITVINIRYFLLRSIKIFPKTKFKTEKRMK